MGSVSKNKSTIMTQSYVKPWEKALWLTGALLLKGVGTKSYPDTTSDLKFRVYTY